MTVKEALKATHNYPVSEETLTSISEDRGLSLSNEITKEVRDSDAYKLTYADLLQWISFAPNISEGGVNVQILYSDRKAMREEANRVYGELGDSKYVEPGTSLVFTYQGDDI